VVPLGKHIYKREENARERERQNKKSEKQHRETPRSEKKEELLQGVIFLASHGEPMLEQVYPEELESVKRTHSGAGEQCEEEGAAERQLLCTDCKPSAPLTVGQRTQE